MRSYVHLPNIDKDTENAVKSCKGCAQAAKVPPIKFNPWPKTDLPGSRIPIDFAGPLVRYYYLIVVDSFSMWPEEHRCKTQQQKLRYNFYMNGSPDSE